MEVDYNDFAMTVLDDPTMQCSRDSYPLYLFFGKVPDDDVVVAIFGLPDESATTTSPVRYKGIAMRSRDMAIQYGSLPHSIPRV